MNKRIFSALLVLAMVFTFAPFAAAEANAAEAFNPTTTVCSKCLSVPEGGWVPYEGQTTSGHYYIPEGYSLGGQIDLAVGAEICINMNGQKVVTGNHRAFMLTYAPAGQKAPVLSLMGSGYLASGATTGTNDGDVIFMRHSNASNPNGGTLNIMDDVVLKNNGTAGSNGKLGGIVYVGDGCTVNMSGGQIDGSAKTNFTWEGGAVYMTGANARFNMTGGEIIGGKANCGGAVCAENGAKFTMSNDATVSTVANVSRQGGVFRLQGAGTELIINGGTITGTTLSAGANALNNSTTGTTDDETLRSQNYGGGAIYATREAKITMTNGTVNGANSVNGGAVYLVDATMDFVGGTINCGTGTRGGGVFLHNTTGWSVLNVGSKEGNTVATMNGNLTGSVYNGACFQTNSVGCIVNLYSGAVLKAGKISQGTVNCGGGALFLSGGATVNMYDGARIDGSTVDSTGSPGGAIYQSSGTFNMYGGEIIGGTLDAVDASSVAKKSNLGGAIYTKGGNFNMNGGTISGGKTNYQGGNLYISNGTFTMNDGLITGGQSADNGGNVALVGGDFIMNGGNVTDGKSTGQHAGNFCVNNDNSLLDINGGTVSGGTAAKQGGNIWVLKGEVNVANASVTGGKAGTGGNFYVRGGTTTVSNTAIISRTDATSNTGLNVYMHASAAATFNDCYFKSVADNGGYGRNFYLEDGTAEAKTTVTLNNCILADNKANATGSGNGVNVYIAGANTKVDLDGMTTCPQFYFDGIGDIEVGDDFVGQVHLRYGLAVGADVPANLTHETGYADTGVLYQDTNKLLFVTNGEGGFKVSDTAFDIKIDTKLGASIGEAQINYRDPNGTYTQRGFDTLQEAINAYALINTPNAFIRIKPVDDVVKEFTAAFNGGANNTLTVNLSGEAITGITLAEGTTLEIMDSVGGGYVSNVSGEGTVAASFVAPGGVKYIVSYSDDAYHSGSYTLNTKSYLRTSKETLAFQSTYDVSAAVGAGVKEIGIEIYTDRDGNGELELVKPVVYNENFDITKDALETVRAGGKYNAAYVALDSQGYNEEAEAFRSNWWGHDITVKAYIKVATADGGEETVYGDAVTQNFQQAVLKYIDNELVQQMINEHTGGDWDQCDPERFDFAK